MTRTGRTFGIASLMGLVAASAVVFAASRLSPGLGLLLAAVTIIAAARVRAERRGTRPPSTAGGWAMAWVVAYCAAVLLVITGGMTLLIGAVLLFFLPGFNILFGVLLALYVVGKAREALWPPAPPDPSGIVWIEGSEGITFLDR